MLYNYGDNMKEKSNILFEKMKVNSIGNDKISEYKPIKKQIKFKFAKIAIITMLSMTCLTGCGNMISQDRNVTEQTIESNYNGYSLYDIHVFENYRLNTLLNNYNLTEYEENNRVRSYSYTVEDYKQISELDDSYLYAFYNMCDTQTVTTVCNALGYQDLNDYLIKNNYITKSGNPDTYEWSEANSENISNIMLEELSNGKGAK